MPMLAAYVAMLVFDLAIMAGTAYAVFWLGFSGWWFALAVLIISGSSPKKLFCPEEGSEEAPEG
ncbi:hypothetical protein EZH22_24720 [Xanthobacter dioxanivorans]|uniref:Uncharacterized protein n=1 Tax=Xanthobacter dioxanivorans TaxID=2528964 RepID=A0A974PMQ5_9HYPH|nr:hypothetical protein [Xanthobacter dioxanivorans]QRG06153.1 hypothetical protein EZH22_24720 [Xanthobacter dioxanivorans]